jgi:urea transport system permease protein
MGMYLMRQIGSRGVYGNPILPDFMVFLNYKELPWFWYGFDSFPFAMLMVLAVPGLLAFVFGWFAFRSRVTGVYLSIITQALTYALLLAFFRNDMGFGGNNGLTDFKDILGFNVQADDARGAVSR